MPASFPDFVPASFQDFMLASFPGFLFPNIFQDLINKESTIVPFSHIKAKVTKYGIKYVKVLRGRFFSKCAHGGHFSYMTFDINYLDLKHSHNSINSTICLNLSNFQFVSLTTYHV